MNSIVWNELKYFQTQPNIIAVYVIDKDVNPLHATVIDLIPAHQLRKNLIANQLLSKLPDDLEIQNVFTTISLVCVILFALALINIPIMLFYWASTYMNKPNQTAQYGADFVYLILDISLIHFTFQVILY